MMPLVRSEVRFVGESDHWRYCSHCGEVIEMEDADHQMPDCLKALSRKIGLELGQDWRLFSFEYDERLKEWTIEWRSRKDRLEIDLDNNIVQGLWDKKNGYLYDFIWREVFQEEEYEY